MLRKEPPLRYVQPYRYASPKMANKRQMEAALRHADLLRVECRGKLNLSVSYRAAI
jgi:hypothetical protein